MKKILIDTSNIRGNFVGGLTAAALSFPLALAFGVQSGMGALAGLYAAIAIGMMAALFGGTPTMISGPTGPMTVVAAAIIAFSIETSGSLDAAMGSIITIFVLAGILQVVFGLLKIGAYFRYIPYPVVSGFISGIGILLIVLQIFPILGYPSPKNVLDIFAEAPGILNEINYSALGLATATIAIIYLLRKISLNIPGSFAALMILTPISAILGLNVNVIDNISGGFSELQIDTLALNKSLAISTIVLSALTLAVVGAIESLLNSVVADNKTKTRHDCNEELIGQGMGNMLSAVIGGIPGAGASIRTIVNIKAGGKTRLSGVIHSIALLTLLLVTARYVQLIPLPVLAGVLFTVGIELINFQQIKHIIRIPKTEAVIMLIVLVLTVFADVFQAITLGVVMASFLFMKKIGDMTENKSVSGKIEEFTHEKSWADEVKLAQEIQNKIYIKHFNNPIFKGFTHEFLALTQSRQEIEIVILRMEKVTYIDLVGVYAIKEAITALRKKNIMLLITGLQHQPRDMLKKVRMIPYIIPEDTLYPDFQSAIKTLTTDHAPYHLLPKKRNINSTIRNQNSVILDSRS